MSELSLNSELNRYLAVPTDERWLAKLLHSVSYALVPQTTNEIRFVVSTADSNWSTR